MPFLVTLSLATLSEMYGFTISMLMLQNKQQNNSDM